MVVVSTWLRVKVAVQVMLAVSAKVLPQLAGFQRVKVEPVAAVAVGVTGVLAA